ncbi:MAG: uroporphyrinogen decarboxylase family protein [Kiritimatiellales bacterium]
MDRKFYLDLAAKNQRLPIAVHLTLHEYPNVTEIELNGELLADAVIKSARRHNSPLAVPLMDLTLEKEMLLKLYGVPDADIEKYHFSQTVAPEFIEKISSAPLTPRMKATCEAISYVAAREKELGMVTVGMGIGPFSLVTQLIADPISAVFLAGMGMTGADEDDVALLEQMSDVATRVVIRYLTAQAEAGAKALFICEPAANLVYFSPNQLEAGSDIFERFVLEPNLKVKAVLDKLGVDLIFHNCGELTDDMVKSFNRLDPVILSLGSSRVLWNDAGLVSKNTVMYGNLPSKKFYSDEAISADEVKRLTLELEEKMKATGHPFILGTECDVLSVPCREKVINSKINAMMNA